MKSIYSFIFAIASLVYAQAQAAEPFSSNLGKYKIEACQYSLNEDVMSADSMCKDYSQLEVVKNEQGILQVVLSGAASAPISFPIEIYDRSQIETIDTAKYEEYGDYHIWTHLQDYTKDSVHVLKIDRTVFDFDVEQKTILFSLSESQFADGIKKFSNSHQYKISKMP